MTHERDKLPSPFAAGIRCRCPRCGEGPLFDGYLKVVARCRRCGLDLGFAESADGPAVFIMFIVGFIVVALALIVNAVFRLPAMIHLLLWIPTTIVLSLILLRPFKGVMIALQYQHDAREGRPD